MDISKLLMVVDDNTVNLKLITAHIKALNLDYFVLTHTNSEELFINMKSLIPDVFLLDVCMPGESGFDIAKKIKDNKIFKDIPIIFITSLDDIESMIEGYDLGAVKYVSLKVFLKNTKEILTEYIDNIN